MKIGVYGSLRRGMGNHSLLERYNATFICEMLVNGIIIYSKPNAGFPYACKYKNGVAIIEVYEVSHQCLAALDSLEGHPDWYTRTPVTELNGKNVEVYLQANAKPSEDDVLISDWSKFVADRNARNAIKYNR